MNKRILVLLSVLTMISGESFNQEMTRVDSLNKAYKNATLDSNRVNTLLELALEYYLSDPDTTITICEKSLDIARKAKYNHGVSESYGWLAYLYEKKGMIEKALDYYNDALLNLEKIGDKKNTASILNNIAYIYQGQNDFHNAYSYFKRSLNIKIELKDEKGMGTAYNNIGAIYQKKNIPDSALYYFQQGYNLRVKTNDYFNQANSLANIGGIYLSNKEYDRALETFRKGHAIRKQIGHKESLAHSNRDMGQVFLKMNELDSAEYYCKQSFQLAEELGYPSLIERSALFLYQIYDRKGDAMKALRYHVLFANMRDSILNEESQKNTIRQQTKYEYEKKKAIDEELHLAEIEKQKAISEEQQRRKNVIIGSISFGLVLVIIFSGFLYNRFMVTRKQRNIIQNQKDEVSYQKELIEEKNREIMDSIMYAKNLQSAILPPVKFIESEFPESFVLYKPKDIVAGDFYWMEKPEGKLFIAVADCTGHGVPGAMMSVMCSNALTKSVKELFITDPAKILDQAAKILEEQFEKSEEHVRDGMDAIVCAIDNKLMLLEYAGANNPLYIVRNNELIILAPDHQPVGKHEDRLPFTLHQFKLQIGDLLYLATDGYTDQFGGPDGKKLRTKKLKEMLLKNHHLSMQEQKEIYNNYFEEWKGRLEQIDDVSILGIRIS